jgi:outer membrane protein assembly factor BamD (BamD/ComL family)
MRLFLSILCALLLFACGNSTDSAAEAKEKLREQQLENIKQLESQLGNIETMNPDVAQRLLIAYQDYYNQNHADTICARFLMEGANIAEGTEKYSKAIQLLLNYHDGYTQAPNRDFALYRIGYIYDAKLHDAEKATAFYNRVIEIYPNSKWATEAQAALQLVNMTDEQLIEFLQRKNAQSKPTE